MLLLLLLLILILIELINSLNDRICDGNLVIGAATGYNVDQIFSFVTSYKYSGTSLSSSLLLLLHESKRNDIELIYFLKRYNVLIEYVIPDNEHIAYFRFKWKREYLRNSSNIYCNIFLTDVRDAYFQGNFFNELAEYIGPRSNHKDYLLLSQEGLEGGKKLNTCTYHYETSISSCFYSILQDRELFMENNMICSGSITGSHMGIVRLLDLVVEYIGYLDPNCMAELLTDQFLLNMLVHQYFVFSEELDLFIPDNFYSPTFTIGNVPNSSFHIGENFELKIFPKTGGLRIPPYINQVDRHPTLENLVKQKLSILDKKDLSTLPISIVMISYRSTDVLIHTLQSYITSKLLNIVFECIIYLQEISDKDIETIEKLSSKFKIIGSSANLHLAHAVDTLFNAVTMPYVLLLEKDWEITVNEETVLAELNKGINALRLEIVDIYQLRSVDNPGFPNFLKIRYEHFEDELFTNDIGLLCGVRFWISDYQNRWPKHFYSCGEGINCSSSWSCDYNNHPYLVSQVFYQKYLGPEIKKIKQQVALGLVSIDNLQIEPWFTENLNAWRTKNFTIGLSQGIFTHNDFIKYKDYTIKDREVMLPLDIYEKFYYRT